MTGAPRHHFDKLKRLPPYILAEVIDLMKSARRAGSDVIDLGMGNPDMATPPHVVAATSARYQDVFRRLTGKALADFEPPRFGIDG